MKKEENQIVSVSKTIPISTMTVLHFKVMFI